LPNGYLLEWADWLFTGQALKDLSKGSIVDTKGAPVAYSFFNLIDYFPLR
jgi:hypothetical protein